jgi:hypothetical protein
MWSTSSVATAPGAMTITRTSGWSSWRSASDSVEGRLSSRTPCGTVVSASRLLRRARNHYGRGSDVARGPVTGVLRRPLTIARAVYRRDHHNPPGKTRTMNAASDIAEFLASRRARITPEQAGLPSYGRRRVPGLRREEVASLAGVSADYYRRLERGQVSGVSELGARSAGPGAPARRCRARAPLRPCPRHGAGGSRFTEAHTPGQEAHSPGRAAPPRPDRSAGDHQRRPRGQRAWPCAVRARPSASWRSATRR